MRSRLLLQGKSKRLGREEAARIRTFLRTRIAGNDDPRRFGKALKGSELGDLWRYRVGDYRILCDLRNDVLIFHEPVQTFVFQTKRFSMKKRCP